MKELVIISAAELQELLRSTVKQELILLKTSDNKSVQDEILDFKETLKLLRISPPTLYKRMREGEIPFKRLGKRILFSKSELLNALQSAKVKHQK